MLESGDKRILIALAHNSNISTDIETALAKIDDPRINRILLSRSES